MGQAGAVKELSSTESRRKSFDDALYHSDLMVKRGNYLHSVNWRNWADNYADANRMIYLRLRRSAHGREGKEQSFSFLVGADEISIAGQGKARFAVTSEDSTPHFDLCHGNTEVNRYQVLPVLVLVGKLVDTPKKVVPSRVWFLGQDKIPLVGREFLFELCDRAPVWKRFRLPIVAETPEWEPYARNATTVSFDKRHHHLVERGTQMVDTLGELKSDVDRGQFVDACNYVRCLPIFVEHASAFSLVPKPLVDQPFEVEGLALSTGDLFQ